MATYVKAWAFFAVIVVLAMTITSSALLYMEAQNTNGLVEKLTKDFETKMVNITTNNSILISNAMATFQIQLAAVNAQVETLATAKGNLESQVSTLTGQVTEYQTKYVNQLNITTHINTTWSLFEKAFNKGLLLLKQGDNRASDGKVNFTNAYTTFLATNYTGAKTKAILARANYNSSIVKYNESVQYFQIANNKVTQNWTNSFVTMYVNLKPLMLNFTYEMGKTCYYLWNASNCYAGADVAGGLANKAIMLNRWQMYNVSHNSYINSTKAIDTLLGAL